jgi:hypothetical protein
MPSAMRPESRPISSCSQNSPGFEAGAFSSDELKGPMSGFGPKQICGSFGPDEIEVMKAAYEAALIDVGVTDGDDPITGLIAKQLLT